MHAPTLRSANDPLARLPRPQPPRRWAGAYERRDDGAWHYAGSLDAVPGARDLSRTEQLGLPAGADVLVPTQAVAADRFLCDVIVGVLRLPEQHLRAGSGYLVPAAVWTRLDGPVGMHAPELQVHAMLSLRDVSELTGLTESTLRVYRGRGTMVAPQATIARTPLWSRPVVERWMATRSVAA
ncbi:hypothetical protein FTX61_03735 [Nitriliruptoraceae bacterium ZYF776]|nr:hypothetical protein [Profundirhabdus halotolerans]